MVNTVYHRTLPVIERYFRPRTVEEALSCLSACGEKAKILAGGTDLVVMMRRRRIIPQAIIDINGVSALRHISCEDGVLKIGALATITSVERSPAVAQWAPCLQEAARQMATVQVKNMGTVVGNICRASPAADAIPPLLVLEADVRVAGPAGTRSVPLNQFFTGPGKTTLRFDELVTEVQIPEPRAGMGSAFARITRNAADLAKVSVAVVLVVNGKVCTDARIALGAVAPTPLRAGKAEQYLQGKIPGGAVVDEVAGMAADEIQPITDVRSTAGYRKQVSRVLVQRAVRRAYESARKIGE